MSLFKVSHKRKTHEKENVERIKAFFVYHHGDGMAMHRDDPEKYMQYRSLQDDIIENWRQELIREDFESLSNAPENTWLIVGNLIRLISSSHNLVENHFKRLLVQIIEKSSTLDKRQRILILEHFAGRTASQEDGAIYLIHNKSTLNELTITAVSALSNFSVDASDNLSDIGWENMQQDMMLFKNRFKMLLKNTKSSSNSEVKFTSLLLCISRYRLLSYVYISFNHRRAGACSRRFVRAGFDGGTKAPAYTKIQIVFLLSVNKGDLYCTDLLFKLSVL